MFRSLYAKEYLLNIYWDINVHTNSCWFPMRFYDVQILQDSLISCAISEACLPFLPCPETLAHEERQLNWEERKMRRCWIP